MRLILLLSTVLLMASICHGFLFGLFGGGHRGHGGCGGGGGGCGGGCGSHHRGCGGGYSNQGYGGGYSNQGYGGGYSSQGYGGSYSQGYGRGYSQGYSGCYRGKRNAGTSTQLDAKHHCNNPKLLQILHKNMHKKTMELSLHGIQTQMMAELNTSNYTIICSEGKTGFVIFSDDYCMVENGRLNCYAFAA